MQRLVEGLDDRAPELSDRDQKSLIEHSRSELQGLSQAFSFESAARRQERRAEGQRCLPAEPTSSRPYSEIAIAPIGSPLDQKGPILLMDIETRDGDEVTFQEKDGVAVSQHWQTREMGVLILEEGTILSIQIYIDNHPTYEAGGSSNPYTSYRPSYCERGFPQRCLRLGESEALDLLQDLFDRVEAVGTFGLHDLDWLDKSWRLRRTGRIRPPKTCFDISRLCKGGLLSSLAVVTGRSKPDLDPFVHSAIMDAWATLDLWLSTTGSHQLFPVSIGHAEQRMKELEQTNFCGQTRSDHHHDGSYEPQTRVPAEGYAVSLTRRPFTYHLEVEGERFSSQAPKKASAKKKTILAYLEATCTSLPYPPILLRSYPCKGGRAWLCSLTGTRFFRLEGRTRELGVEEAGSGKLFLVGPRMAVGLEEASRSKHCERVKLLSIMGIKSHVDDNNCLCVPSLGVKVRGLGTPPAPQNLIGDLVREASELEDRLALLYCQISAILELKSS